MTAEEESGYARPGRSAGRLRLPRVLFIGLLLVAVLLAGVVLWSQQARVFLWEERARAMRTQLTQAQEQAESLTGQLAQADAARRSLADQLSAAQRTADQTQHALTLLQQEQTASSARVTALQGEKEALATQLAAALKEREESRRQVTALQADKSTLESRYRMLEQRVASLTRDTHAPQAGRASAGGGTGVIELPPIVVHHPAPSLSSPAVLPAASARIVEVNERYRFVVIDQGSAEGIEPGMRFAVLRNGRVLGRVTVRQVREHLSACDAEPSGEAALPFHIGDDAVLQRG